VTTSQGNQKKKNRAEQKPEEQWNHASALQKEHSSVDLMILYFWPVELGENRFLLL
jgi:hypothetical protein